VNVAGGQATETTLAALRALNATVQDGLISTILTMQMNQKTMMYKSLSMSSNGRRMTMAKVKISCPCGSKLFWRSRAVYGLWKELLDETGAIQETDLSNVRHGQNPKTVVCAACSRLQEVKT
jgi:hypothetical protein